MDFPGGALVKNPPASAGDPRDAGSVPGSGRSPGGGNANPLSILAWDIPWTEERGGLHTIRGIAESDTTERAHTHVLVNSNLFSRVLARHLWRDAFCYNWCNIDWTAFTPNSYDETLTSKVIICRAHKEVITRSSKGGGPDMIRLTPLWGETPKDALPNSAPCSHNDEVLWGYGKMETTTREASMETTLAFWSQTSSL